MTTDERVETAAKWLHSWVGDRLGHPWEQVGPARKATMRARARGVANILQHGHPGDEPHDTEQPGLPATLSTVADVAAVCAAAGLALGAYGDEWGADGVRVGRSEHVGRLGTVYTHRGLMNGRQPIADVYHGAPSSLLSAAIEAARTAGGTL